MVFSIKDRQEVLVTNTREATALEVADGICEVIDRVIIRFEDTRPYTFIEQVIVHKNGEVTENLIS
jgi:hypothetical protein